LQRSILLVFLQFFFFNIYSSPLFGQELNLNEIMSSNSTTMADEDGDYEDWIEVFYFGDEPLNLQGFGLSDDYDQPFRWVFPDTTIYPGEFILVWASNKDRAVAGMELHTNFAISASGEEVILTHPDGTRLDELPPTSIPTDVSIGRQPDGTGSWVYFTEPTPGAVNDTEGFSEKLSPPVFSHEAGFYTEEFDLQITHPDPQVTLHYTLDGSEPADTSPVYSGALNISDGSSEPNSHSSIPTTSITSGSRAWMDPDQPVRKATILRVKASKPGALSSAETRTYFVFPEGAE
jgi:hypothetical protein